MNKVAFGRRDEADLVDRLREEGAVLVSLVAELAGEAGVAHGGQIVGHILFSRMTVETAEGSVAAVSLAPMAVLPDYQAVRLAVNRFVEGWRSSGSAGNALCWCWDTRSYYPRFGFSAEKARHLASPFPAEAFMALELVDGALAEVRGSVRYAGAFGL